MKRKKRKLLTREDMRKKSYLRFIRLRRLRLGYNMPLGGGPYVETEFK